MTVSQRPGPQITDEDIDAARVATSSVWATVRDPDAAMRKTLATVLRPGGLVARAIADELERIAASNFAVDEDGRHYAAAVNCSTLQRLASEWRDGR